MKILKVLNFEDSAVKHAEIVRTLNFAGVSNITWVRSLSEGVAAIQKAAEDGHPFTLIITDMNFPDAPGSRTDPDAGEKAALAGAAEKPPIPVVVCSSVRYQIPGTTCIWYNPWGDWDEELTAWVNKFRRE